MKKIILGSLILSGLALTACSGSESHDEIEMEETVDSVSEETQAELEAAQNLNIEAQELHDELDAMLDSLN